MNRKPLRELALFAGAGGGLLASRLLGWKTVHAVEKNPFRRTLLKLRQREGHLDQFGISEDVKHFRGENWWGKVDIVTGGFPCQPFSSAARGRNNAEDLWPEMLRIIVHCDPKYVFAENVEQGAIERAAEQLFERGYQARYCMLSSASLGAPHPRKRWWVAANAYRQGQPRRPEHVEVASAPAFAPLEWWQDDSRAMGIPDGISDRMDRLQALGDAQVPAVAATAWQLLMEGE